MENLSHVYFAKRKRGVPNDLQELWRVADLIDGFYCNHRTYNSIQEIFEKE
jgi:hypothetical protein